MNIPVWIRSFATQSFDDQFGSIVEDGSCLEILTRKVGER